MTPAGATDSAQPLAGGLVSLAAGLSVWLLLPVASTGNDVSRSFLSGCGQMLCETAQ
jgi:hypothetical protein